MKVVTGKNLYIAEKAEKKLKRIKLDFDKFLYFRHLETLHSSSFLTVSIFLGLLQDQENDMKQEFPTHISLHNLLFPLRSLLPWNKAKEWQTICFYMSFWSMPNNRFFTSLCTSKEAILKQLATLKLSDCPHLNIQKFIPFSKRPIE